MICRWCTEGLFIELKGAFPRLCQILGVLFATHSKIREMMKEESKSRLTILGIFLGVQNMEMPEIVDSGGRHDRLIREMGTVV